MAQLLPTLHLVRHGATDWAEIGRHTGRSDIPLNERGLEHARLLGQRLRSHTFQRVLTSPLIRAQRTCELAGFEGEMDPDLAEWDYGGYEGATSAEIRALRPDWVLFRDGCPGGESPEDVARRADRVLAKFTEIDGDVLAFTSAHISRMIAARWLGLPIPTGQKFVNDVASVSVLGFEHTRSDHAMRLWNDTSHLVH